ncbi:MAG TPA: biopolymer transporter ExbD [Candidatus Angelobacter sp.]|jgi:biopolymer transport protein ExbD|nr:biopolymer transporter ExbD [Candidatus Angelobacter sp.]
MAMTSGSQEKVASEINVTPMIDVLLVLLIIFMVIQPEIKLGEAAETPHPAKANPETQAVHPPGVVIGLYRGDGGKMPLIKVDQEEVAWNDLTGRLREIYKSRAEKIAFLRGDPDVEFQFVADVVDMTHVAGIDRVGLLPSKD